ncbi:hypothetical protein LP7551_05409 [Roseibium album]|nr:hypothetical protein LP7551_05409 [Roseibium album]
MMSAPFSFPVKHQNRFAQLSDQTEMKSCDRRFGQTSEKGKTMPHHAIDFRRISDAALLHADQLVKHWLPDGHREGSEWVALNPRRADHRRGSFKVNTVTGCWGDFATGDCGGDFVSLAAFLFDHSQKDAALKIAAMLGVNPHA